MASEQMTSQAIMQAPTEGTRAAIIAVRGAEIPANTTRPVPAVTKTGGHVLQQSHASLEVSR